MRIRTALLLGGLLIAAIALLAETFGLDPSVGWGLARITLLIVGLAIALTGLASPRSRSTPSVIASGGGRSDPLTRWWKEYWFVLPAVAAVVLVYLWCATSGTLATWDSPTRYYADLARGFLRGNLHLATRELQIDYSVFEGRYYLYFGPVPALLLALLSPFISGRVGDLQLTFVFLTLTFAALCLTAVVIWNRFFAGLPRYLLACTLLVLGLAGPAAFMLNTYLGGRIYEAAISGGQAFLTAGLLAAVAALVGLRPNARTGWLILAGALWALAIGTRVALAPAVGLMVLVLAVSIWSAEPAPRRRVTHLAALGLPLIIAAAILGWYNWARFGSVFETGLLYQENWTSGEYNRPYAERINASYIIQNLYNYLLHPPGLRARFPYLQAEYARAEPILPFYAPGPYTAAQEMTGVIFAAPFLLFALIPGIALVRDLRRTPRGAQSESARALNVVVLTLTAAIVAGAAVLVTFRSVAARYAEDITPCLLLLAMIGFWQCYRSLSQRPGLRTPYVVAGLTLAAVSVAVSTLLALSAAMR